MHYEVRIDPKLFDTYPDIRLGLIRFQADIQPPDAAFWAYLGAEILPQVRAALEGREWSQVPGVRGSRAAYKAFGRNPGRYRVSSEALLRRVRRGDKLYPVNSVVDVNNLLSLQSGLSVGSYDLANIHGPIILRRAVQGEGYTGIGKDLLDLENMLVLADDAGIFGSSMSDSTRAMVTEETKEILAVIYCFDRDTDLAALLASARQAFERFAGAKALEAWSI